MRNEIAPMVKWDGAEFDSLKSKILISNKLKHTVRKIRRANG